MNTEMTYRRTFASGASPIGMMIALFDTLAGNFRRASDAIRENDIERRCKELNHATLVLGQLETWLDLERGGEAAQTLALYYSSLRSKMLEASAMKSAEILEEQIESILHIRSAWQQIDIASTSAQPENRISNAAGARMQFSEQAEDNGDRLSLSV